MIGISGTFETAPVRQPAARLSMGDTTDENGQPAAARLWNRDFRLLWQGQLVSQLGNQAFALAMMYWLMEETGSATLMGFVMMASMLPGVILGPFGGTFADRHSRKSIIVMSDLVRGVAVLIVASILSSRPDATGLIVASLFAVSFLNGVVGAAFNPAVSAAIPDLVPPDRIPAANALNQFSARSAMLIGQAAGGILYRFLGAPLLFVIDGASYLLSAVSESFIRLPAGEAPAERRNMAGALAAYRDDTMTGLRYLRRDAGMCGLLMIAAAINFLAMPVIVLLPFFVSHRLAAGPEWYGFLLASMGAGSLATYVLLTFRKMPAARRAAAVPSSLLLVGGAFAVLGATRDSAMSITLLFTIGACTAYVNVISMSLFQTAAPPGMRGRIMSLVYTLSGAASPLGMAVGGALGDLTNKNVAVVYPGCGASVVAVGLLAFSGSIRQFLAHEPSGNG